MNRPPSQPPEDPSHSLETTEKAVEIASVDLGLSRADLEELIPMMLAVVGRVGCHAHVHPLEVVHDAFVVALCKPVEERPPIEERKRFFAWMCTLAEYAALTNRKSKHRKILAAETLEEAFDVLVTAPEETDYVGMHERLRKAIVSLAPKDRAFIEAHFFNGKSIKEIADEQDRPWTTIASRRQRVLNLLRTALQSTIVAILLFFTKNARARGARVGQHVSRLFPQAMQATCAMTVTMACGVMVPANSLAAVAHREDIAAVSVPAPGFTVAEAKLPLAPQPSVEVAPVKPIVVDKPEEDWSASRMNSKNVARFLQGTIVPFAFLAVPAMTEIACAGAERQTPPPQEPEERDDTTDPYEMMCKNAVRLGAECPTKAEWYKSMGRCPDGTKGCQ